MLIDTHCHLDFPDFDADRDEVIENAVKGGLERLINVSSSLTGSRNSIGLSEKYDMVYCSVGIHPHDTKDASDAVFKEIENLAKANKVVAIGEVGLDFYRNLSPADIQKEYFLRFIALSIERSLPLIIHCRQAEKEVLEILRKESSKPLSDRGGLPGFGLKGVVHCFSGTEEFLESCLEMGLYISFTCNITYKKSGGLRQLASRVPLNKLLLETDCPFLAPQDLRGRRNEPANVKYLARTLARIRNSSIEEIARATTDNAKRLFGL